MTVAQILEAAMTLPVPKRELLIELLQGSLDRPVDSEILESQIAEVEDRWAAYERGEMEALDGDTVMAELKK